MADLQAANCLGTSTYIILGQHLYLPELIWPTITPWHTLTPTAWNCPQPAGWSVYLVPLNDTLSSISVEYRVSVAELQSANCMEAATMIWEGQLLYVPQNLTGTPSP